MQRLRVELHNSIITYGLWLDTHIYIYIGSLLLAHQWSLSDHTALWPDDAVHKHRHQGSQVFTGRTSAQVAKKTAAPAMERTRESEEMSVQSDQTLSEEEGGGRVEDRRTDSVSKAKQGKKGGQVEKRRLQKTDTVEGQGRDASTEGLPPSIMRRRGREANAPRDQGTQAGGRQRPPHAHRGGSCSHAVPKPGSRRKPHHRADPP